MSVPPTNSNPLVPHVVNTPPVPHQTRPPIARIIWWSPSILLCSRNYECRSCAKDAWLLVNLLTLYQYNSNG